MGRLPSLVLQGHYQQTCNQPPFLFEGRPGRYQQARNRESICREAGGVEVSGRLGLNLRDGFRDDLIIHAVTAQAFHNQLHLVVLQPG